MTAVPIAIGQLLPRRVAGGNVDERLGRRCVFPIHELRITTGLVTGLVALGVAWLVRDAAVVRVWPHLVLGLMFLGSVTMWLADPWSEFRRDNLEFVARQALLVVLFQGVPLFIAGLWLRASPYAVLGTLCWVVAAVPVVLGVVAGAAALASRPRGPRAT